MGYFLIGIGIFLGWVVVSGKSQKFISALGYQLPNTQKPFFVTGQIGFPGQTRGPATSASSGGSTSQPMPDTGVHMGLDSSGAVFTIPKTYAQASDSERAAMNAFGRKFPGGLIG